MSEPGGRYHLRLTFVYSIQDPESGFAFAGSQTCPQRVEAMFTEYPSDLSRNLPEMIAALIPGGKLEK